MENLDGMRRRITFVHDANDDFDQDQIEVDETSIRLRALKAAREDRLTFGFDELPFEACFDHVSCLIYVFHLVTGHRSIEW